VPVIKCERSQIHVSFRVSKFFVNIVNFISCDVHALDV